MAEPAVENGRPMRYAEAKRAGLRFYGPTTLCPAGHLAPRRVSNKTCVECQREASARSRKRMSAAAQPREARR